MNQFFVSTPIGFENAALTEMKDVWPYLLGKDAKPQTAPFPAITVVQGGFEFEADLFTGLQLNFFLKSANRVLLRLASFKARDLPKFYQKFKVLPWKDYLFHPKVNFEVAAQKSRVNNEKRLQESAEAALSELFDKGATGEVEASVYIRMDDDQCTISLDTTGEHLHKRGWSVLKGEAPLRETIAAYLVKEMIDTTPLAALQDVVLIDPMTGAGTFLTEARTLGHGQFTRPFAFQKWKRAPKLFLSSSFVYNYALPERPGFKSFLGADIDEDIVKVAQKNFIEVERQLALSERDKFKAADVEFKVFDSVEGEKISEAKAWMILNPPYGERLAASEGLQGLANQLCQYHAPERVGILYPEKERVTQIPKGYKKLKEVKINNGGLRCLFTVLTRV